MLVLVVGTALATAQAPPATPASCLERTVAISLMPEKRGAIPDLTNASFRARLGGAPVDVVGASAGPSPRHVVLMVDTSGSMEQAFALALQLAADAVRRLPDGTSVALVFFGDRKETVGFGATRDELLRNLDINSRAEREDVPV